MGFVAAALGGSQQAVNFKGGEVLMVAHIVLSNVWAG